MTYCTVLDYPPGPVTGMDAVTGLPHDWPADLVVAASCPCAHVSREPMCEDHARLVADGEGFCSPCAASGHRCPLEIKARETLP